MATFDFLPNSWSNTERALYENAFLDVNNGYGTAYTDDVAQAMYHEGYFNFDISSDHRIAIRDALHSYLMDEYAIDFDSQFDWAAWREMYDGEG